MSLLALRVSGVNNMTAGPPGHERDPEDPEEAEVEMRKAGTGTPPKRGVTWSFYVLDAG
jgi:hypothetical protein